MDSDQKCTAITVILCVSFLLGLLGLGRILDPYTMQTATFSGKETRVAVYTERQAVSIGWLNGGIQVFKQNSNMMTRVIFAPYRRGFLYITTHTASVDEVELFRKFFPRSEPVNPPS